MHQTFVHTVELTCKVVIDVKYYDDMSEQDYINDEYDEGYNLGVLVSKTLVEEQADKPRVRARWIDDRCSLCGGEALYEIFGGLDSNIVLSKFCPHCGAYMER